MGYPESRMRDGQLYELNKTNKYINILSLFIKAKTTRSLVDD